MRIQFHIYFSKKTQLKFERCKLFIMQKLLPIFMKFLRMVEGCALAVAAVTACGMESEHLIPIVRTFCISIFVIAASEALYRICWNQFIRFRHRIQTVRKSARNSVLIRQRVDCRRSSVRRLAHHAA